jgi:hypothetical protein
MPEPAPKISALIVAKDEAANLADCLASLAWADETIVVVDASSQDETESMARSLASRVRVRPFDDFARQRNASLELATGDWVFAVDADERATPELAAEIRRALNDPANPHAGFRVPIRSIVLGRSFGYSGTQHDLPLRLFRREMGRWIGTVHETVDLKGSTGQLRSHLTHQTIAEMQTFLRKIDHYTTLEAIKFYREGRSFRLIDLTIRPIWTFFKLYLGKQGFRDGLEGLAFCALSGLSVAVRHWKLREFYLAPSPLVGEVRGGGAWLDEVGSRSSDSNVSHGAKPPPTLTLPHKGGGDQTGGSGQPRRALVPASLPPSPLVGAGRGGGAWQDDRGFKTSDSIVAGGATTPPTLTLPHKGGGDQRKTNVAGARLGLDRTGRPT